MWRIVLNGTVGFVVGIAGGLIGLGGAELRLPYLIGFLKLTPHQAVRINLASSLFTIVAAIPARLFAIPTMEMRAYLPETLAIAAAATLAAYVGASWLYRISVGALSRAMALLLFLLGTGLLIEVFVQISNAGLLPDIVALKIPAGLLFGIAIGSISSVLGVAGGEAIIPTLVFGYGVPITTAGSLSLLISLPTVLTGLMRHLRSGFMRDRSTILTLVIPLGIGSAGGALSGGLLVGLIPPTLLKVGLAMLLMWSATRVLKAHGADTQGARSSAKER